MPVTNALAWNGDKTRLYSEALVFGVCDGMPFWALLEKANCSVFLLACEEIVDVNQRTDGNLNITECFSRLLPAAMFLKSTLKRSGSNAARKAVAVK